MNKPKVFITRKWPASIEAKLKQHYDVTLNTDDRPLIAADEYVVDDLQATRYASIDELIPQADLFLYIVREMQLPDI